MLLRFLRPSRLRNLTFITTNAKEVVGARGKRVARINASGTPFIVVFFGTRTMLRVIQFLLTRGDSSAVPLLLYEV